MASEDGVRATNDDAAQCKRHAVDKGYWKDPYISLICPKGQPKLPEISVGYYARVKGMRTLLDKFLKLTSCACQVVNLGAGFDTTYWNLKDLRLAPRNFVEVDFSGITSKKVAFIKRWKPLLEKVTSEDGEIQVSSTELHSQDYHLVAADLTQISELEKKLKDSGIDKNTPTVFIAECVLVYIEPRKSEELLKWIVDNFSTAFFINYEQVNMIDRFGDIMLENLRARQCTLHVEACKSLESQIKRYISQGWEGADAMEMFHVYSCLPKDDIHRVERIEFLDEKELLDQLFHHYCISWAYKDPNKMGLSQISF
ncbi:hypothetical protein ACJMK2_017462 [Sinanodonta woodiana]|uniref:Leucine carboxyl methyltransferase 1 n=1 Tax=Sinanodonta woodiana TaxID=1069815 RepID=A0ABD3UDJ7_SINWO